jgi:hypothetical protein
VGKKKYYIPILKTRSIVLHTASHGKEPRWWEAETGLTGSLIPMGFA